MRTKHDQPVVPEYYQLVMKYRLIGNVFLQVPDLVITSTNAMPYSERSSYRTIWNTRFIQVRSHEREDASFVGRVQIYNTGWISYIDVATALIAKIQHISYHVRFV